MPSAINLEFDRTDNQPERWKSDLSDAITSTDELLSLLELDQLLPVSIMQSPDFKLRVPRNYVAKMKKGDRFDPLLRQVLPIVDEGLASGQLDPVGDLQAMPTPGLLHKYHGRALIITTGACAIHCRYCFRRHYPYQHANTNKKHLEMSLDYLRSHPEIKEVILSGGDPLILDDVKLSTIIGELETIKHLKWLRIHTRLPVVLASRITDDLLKIFSGSRFRITLVIHTNHANELGHEEAETFQKILKHGITLLNQSVLLKGVNDKASSLIALSNKLHDYGVLPYYLHCFDPVQGAMHFDTGTIKAISLIEEMKNHLPGFLVPKLVKEEPGKTAKTAISSI